jgi:hypothetical protein
MNKVHKHQTVKVQISTNIDALTTNNDVSTTDIDVFKCDGCDKVLSNKTRLNNHKKICKGVSNPLECHYCHNIFSSRASKSNHIKICKAKPKDIVEPTIVNNNIDIKIENPNNISTDKNFKICKNNTTSNYIYLIQEREFVNCDEKIYKIGKTKQDNLRRIKDYPKGSILLLQYNCNNCDIIEKKLINDFKNKYKHQKSIGAEYFEGDYIEMIKDIHNTIIEHDDNNN